MTLAMLVLGNMEEVDKIRYMARHEVSVESKT